MSLLNSLQQKEHFIRPKVLGLGVLISDSGVIQCL